MHVFYIPDGHRRYAVREGLSLIKAYQVGYHVLLEEVMLPLLERPGISDLSIFLLSSLNLKRRASSELQPLLTEGDKLLDALISAVAPLATVRTFGSWLVPNLDLEGPPDRRVNLFIGSSIDDTPDCGEADVFFRSGGELRLSGAPRALLGNYTQLYLLDTLHPDLRGAEVTGLLDRYEQRYVRQTDGTSAPPRS